MIGNLDTSGTSSPAAEILYLEGGVATDGSGSGTSWKEGQTDVWINAGQKTCSTALNWQYPDATTPTTS